MHEIKRRRALPVYIAAATFALYSLIAPLYTLWHFFFAALVTAAAWLTADALIKPTVEYEADPPEPEVSYGEAADAILARAAAFRQKAAASAPAMGADGEGLLALAEISDKIAETAKTPGTDLDRLRRFQDYYLATTEKLADSYLHLAAQGVEGENISAAREKIRAMLDSEQTAFSKFLDALFSAQALDIESEIAVMRMRMRTEGLAEDGGGLDELLRATDEK